MCKKLLVLISFALVASLIGSARVSAEDIKIAGEPNPANGAIGVSYQPNKNTYFSTDVPKNIPDFSYSFDTGRNIVGEVISTLNIPDSARITDLNVELDIRKPGNNADLDVYLKSPDGKEVELFTDIGLHSADDFKNTILDDEAPISIRDGSGSYTGIYKPEGKLSDFDGRDAKGTWRLKVQDDWYRDPGTLNSWRLVIESPMLLKWTPASGAASQDVYFSAKLEDVNSSSASAFLGNLPTDASSIEIGPLIQNQTYYWRVDTHTPDGKLGLGVIWSFTTSDVSETATQPSPADGAVDVAQNVTLGWSSGFNAIAHDVYFGTGSSLVKLERTTGQNFKLPKLATSTTYSWRIDEIKANGTKHTGAVWSFKTVIGEATNPSPADKGSNVPVNVVMKWTPGATAVSHDGYLGTTNPPPFVGNTTENSFDTASIGGLQPSTIYYWRLDAIEADGTKHVGNVWVFKTAGPNAGALASYYQGMTFGKLLLTRTDLLIDFNWGAGSPDPAVGADQFSVTWVAQLEPAFSDTYTLWTQSNDGVFLWLDGKLIIDSWIDQNATWNHSEPIELKAGERHLLQMAYYEKSGDAVARLHWESPTQPRRAIDALQLP